MDVSDPGDERHEPASSVSVSVEPDSRAVAPLVGILALIALAVVLATVIAVGATPSSLETAGPTAAFELSADGDASSIVIEHVAGDAIDVEPLAVTIAVDGEELDEQPPVPFVGANGFDGTPDGPFNAASDSEWRAGERAGLVVAGTNDPAIESGDSVTVTLVADGTRVATLETTAR